MSPVLFLVTVSKSRRGHNCRLLKEGGLRDLHLIHVNHEIVPLDTRALRGRTFASFHFFILQDFLERDYFLYEEQLS